MEGLLSSNPRRDNLKPFGSGLDIHMTSFDPPDRLHDRELNTVPAHF